MIKKLFYLKEQLKTINRINRTLIDLVDSSMKDDKGSYIQLSNGKLFTGQATKDYLKRLHFLLKGRLRERVPSDMMQVLFDIDFRYMSRENESMNLKEGKYLGLKKGDVVFEVGAYVGYHAMRLGELVGASGQVIAVEAIPSNFAIMKKNLELNKIENITPINVAIWNSKDTISMNIDDHQKNSAVDDIVKARKTIELPCDTIDNIFKEQNLTQVDFVRIQTNGAEIEALKGMEEVLKTKPKILVAVPYKNKTEIQDLLTEKGYSTIFTGHSIFAQPH